MRWTRPPKASATLGEPTTNAARPRIDPSHARPTRQTCPAAGFPHEVGCMHSPERLEAQMKIKCFPSRRAFSPRAGVAALSWSESPAEPFADMPRGSDLGGDHEPV